MCTVAAHVLGLFHVRGQRFEGGKTQFTPDAFEHVLDAVGALVQPVRLPGAVPTARRAASAAGRIG